MKIIKIPKEILKKIERKATKKKRKVMSVGELNIDRNIDTKKNTESGCITLIQV